MKSPPAPAALTDDHRARSFRVVFMIELWERFGFYGMVALLVLYMTQQLGMTDEHANLTWGAGAALIYAAPALGGWIGDRVLGARRTMLLGTLILALGYLLLAWPSDAKEPLLFALGVVVVGNGLFKPNAANLVRRIYENDDARLDSAFTLYYMGVNIGSTISMLATPWVKAHYGWHAAFGVCSVGLMCGLLNYALMRNRLRKVAHGLDAQRAGSTVLLVALGALVLAALTAVLLSWQRAALAGVILAAIGAAALFARIAARVTPLERRKLWAVLVFLIQTVLFFIFYQQMSTSLTLFALREVDPQMTLFGWKIMRWQPEQFQALNPIWVMVLSPVLAHTYLRFGRRGQDLTLAAKFALGFGFCAAGFLVYGYGGGLASPGQVSPWIMVAGYGLTAMSELLISGLGLAMVSRYTPSGVSGAMMGVYYAATGVAQYLGSVVANLAKVTPGANLDSAAVLEGYLSLFRQLGGVAALGAVFALVMVPFLHRLGGGGAQLQAG